MVRTWQIVNFGEKQLTEDFTFTNYADALHKREELWKDGYNNLYLDYLPQVLDIEEDWTGRIYHEDHISRDNINHPEHYTSGGIECIDAIRAALTPEEFRGFCKGNVLKYTWRERLKGGDESLKKAEWYLKRLTDEH